MGKILLSISAVFMLFSVTVSAQSMKIDYKFVENKGDKKEVVFTVLGIETPEQEQSLVTRINAHKAVESFKIFYGRRCIALVDKNMTADEMRSMILLENAEISRDYVHIYDKKTEYEISGYTLHNPITGYTRTKGTRVFPKDFPKEDATKSRKENVTAKIQWAQENPEVFKEVMGHEYLDYDLKPATNPRIK
ncbi:MAG: hypothetical protein C0594_09580 [Marinilabiliales bacterium]|nr:MAG: hypothetical protein C0594_09580 [Marinilabiliales bacterium]